jgi:hypothetical protein
MVDSGMPADPSTGLQRYPVPAAAARLGISERAVRGRIARGTLTAERHGRRAWLVLLPLESSKAEGEEREEDLTETITAERRTVVRVGSRGMCSWCGRDLLGDEAVLLDAKPYDMALIGDDWTWHHEACEIAAQLREPHSALSSACR